MKAFTDLFIALDATTRTSAKVAALEHYFRSVPPEDAAWALHFLSGQRMKRLVKTGLLRECAAEAAGLPLWLVEECYETVGDLAETLALILPDAEDAAELPPLHRLVEEHLLPLAKQDETAVRESLRAIWGRTSTLQRLLWNKLLTGAFRVGVSRTLLVRALANIAGVEPPVMDHRLTGKWQPDAAGFRRLLSAAEPLSSEPAQPYPFCLAAPLDVSPPALGDISAWQCEWKWDGIRAQLIRRAGQCVLWSRGEEIITAAFPEIARAAAALPDGTVLDGELLAWEDAAPLPFSSLQRRLNRKTAGTTLQQQVPVIFMAYDLLEHGGTDQRSAPLQDRRTALSALLDSVPSGLAPVKAERWQQGELFDAAWSAPRPAASHLSHTVLRLSPVLSPASWEDLAALRGTARSRHTEGIMLKDRTSPYGTGRHRGAWWKWKIDPLTADMVLVAAQPGHGRRATLFTDYTFAIWRGEELVTVAKAYSGLTDAEITEIDAFVRANTTGRFGPVRSVNPLLVFELAFEGISLSPRHRSGLALRFPRILRIRRDKQPQDADSIESVKALTGAVRS